MPDPIKPKEIAKFAAEGVAIALSARDANFRGPFHIICGIPPDIFNVEILADQQGALRTGKIEEHKAGR
jgi:hypothetical protein